MAQQSNYFLQRHLNSENGLPQNSIKDIAFSESGFMWLATEDGLVRFDGRNCKVFNTQNSGLKKNRIAQLVQTGKKEFACLTDDNKLYQIVESALETSLIQIAQLKELGSVKYNLFKPTSLNQFIRIYQNLPDSLINKRYQFHCFVLDQKKLIIQKCNEGLIVYDTSFHFIKKIKLDKVWEKSLFVDHEELYLYDHAKKFYRIDLTNGANAELQTVFNNQDTLIVSTYKNNDEKLIWDSKMQEAFFIKNNNLYDVSIRHNQVLLTKRVNNLPAYLIKKVSYSKDHTFLVVGSNANGCYIYHQNEFKTIMSAEHDNTYYAQISIPGSNSVLSGSPVQEFTMNGKSKMILNEYLSKFTYYYHQFNQTFWYAQGGYLKHRAVKDWNKTFPIDSNTLITNGIQVIAARDNQSMYVCGAEFFCYYKIDSGLKKLGAFKFSQKRHQAYCILSDGDSLVWIGTDEGLYKYDTKKQVFSFACLEGVIVRALFKTKSGHLLAGTYGNGIYALVENKAISLPLDRHENLKSTHNFLEDKSGFIWMSSNNGLYKLASTTIDNFIKKPGRQHFYYYRYSQLNGLITNEFNGGGYPSAIEVNADTWSFSSMQGLVTFKPDSIKSYFNYDSIYLDKIYLDDSHPINLTDSHIQLPQHQFKLSVYVSSPNWSDEENLQIEYKINENASDNLWIPLKKAQDPIILQNLRGGSHELIIRKKTGVEPESFATLKIVLHVPLLLYERTFFWPIIFLIGVFSIFGISRLSNYWITKKKKKLEKLVDEKTQDLKEAIQLLEVKNAEIKFSEDNLLKENELKSTLLFLLSHDIATPLRFINMFLGEHTSSEPAIPLSASELIDLKISTNNLENLLDNIVTWIKQTHEKNTEPLISSINLKALIEDKIQLFDLLSKKKKNIIHNHVDSKITIESDEFIISMAIQNLLGNAINYTQDGQIIIEYLETTEKIQLSIQDTGKGISAHLNPVTHLNENKHALVGYGIGLKITAELLNLVNGKITLVPNTNGPGTTAFIYLFKTKTIL